MKIINTLVCGLVLTFAINAFAQDKQGVATIVRIQGQSAASYTLEAGPNAKWHPLLVGKILPAGAIIRTGPNTMVDVILGKSVTVSLPEAGARADAVAPAPDAEVRGMVAYKPSVEQNMIRLTEDTTIAIDKLTVSDTGVDAVSDTELDLQHGKIFFSVKKLSPTSQYLIKIPNGIAGVRGTLGSISADGSCWALQHSVWLSITLPDGQTKTIKVDEGHGFNPKTGQIITLPPEVISILEKISISLDTIFYKVTAVTYANDHTTVFISPTTGKSGHNQPTPQ